MDEDLQGCKHVSRTDAVDSDTRVRPLDCQTAREMSDCSFRGVVGCLGLGHIDNGSRHRADHNSTSASFTL